MIEEVSRDLKNMDVAEKEIEEFENQVIESWLEELPAEVRLRGLAPEERLEGLAPEEILEGLTAEELAHLAKLIREMEQKD